MTLVEAIRAVRTELDQAIALGAQNAIADPDLREKEIERLARNLMNAHNQPKVEIALAE